MINWTSVDDQLPSEEDHYLICRDKEVGACVFKEGKFNHANITAWQRFPEPDSGDGTWTKVKDRLPETTGWYIVSAYHILSKAHDPMVTEVAYYDEGKPES